MKNPPIDAAAPASDAAYKKHHRRHRTVWRTSFAFAAVWSAIGIFAAGPAFAASPTTPESSDVGDATSFGVSPATIEIAEAARGGSFASEIIIFNRATKPVQFSVGSAGPVGDWIRVGPEASPVKKYSFSAPPGRTLVNVAISVPTDAPNGTYEAAVTAAAQTSTTGTETSGVSVAFETTINIKVSGEQQATAVFSNLNVAASEIGRPTEIRATIANTGNVSLPLGLQAQVFRSNTLVQTLTTPKQQQVAPPGRSVDVILQWPTTDALPGDYTIEVTATAGSQTLGSKQQTVRVEAPGKLERSLKVVDLEVVQQANARPVLRGTVTNTGDIAGRTTVTATAAVDGISQSTTQGDSFYIAPGESLPFIVTLPLLDKGKYQLTVVAELEDYRSPSEITTFDVRGEKNQLPVLPAIALAGLLGLIVIVRRGRRRHHTPASVDRLRTPVSEQPERPLASTLR